MLQLFLLYYPADVLCFATAALIDQQRLFCFDAAGLIGQRCLFYFETVALIGQRCLFYFETVALIGQRLLFCLATAVLLGQRLLFYYFTVQWRGLVSSGRAVQLVLPGDQGRLRLDLDNMNQIFTNQGKIQPFCSQKSGVFVKTKRNHIVILDWLTSCLFSVK